MTSRCIAIKKLATETYNQYVCYGDVIKDAILASLKAQKAFVERDVLLSDEEREDIRLYITKYITEIILYKYLKSN